jgi:hypothetical protein
MIPAGQSATCGRGDCDAPAVVARTWRSDSGRHWLTYKCADHELDRDGASRLPGFVLEREERITPTPTRCADCPGCTPDQVDRRRRRGACTLPAATS